MTFEDLGLDGPALVTPVVHADRRGFFTERFRNDEWGRFRPGHPGFVQDNFSFSERGVLRGLHYQVDPAQGKLVSCVSGSIRDVAVDIRPGSPTFGRHVAVTLEAARPRWLWIPPGFAHGFAVTSIEGAGVFYKVDCPYSGRTEGAIRWDDPELGIDWGDVDPVLSDKDRAAPSFAAYRARTATRSARA